MSDYPYSEPLPPPRSQRRLITLETPELERERNRYTATYRLQMGVALISAAIGLYVLSSSIFG